MTQEEITSVWAIAEKDGTKDSSEWRLDPFGSSIKKSQYNKKTRFGWTIEVINDKLQAVHWINEKKLKRVNKYNLLTSEDYKIIDEALDYMVSNQLYSDIGHDVAKYDEILNKLKNIAES